MDKPMTMDAQNGLLIKVQAVGDKVLTFIPAKPSDMTATDYELGLMKCACSFVRAVAKRISGSNVQEEKKLVETLCECAQMEDGFEMQINAIGGVTQ